MQSPTSAPLPEMEQHRRDCEVRYWFKHKNLDAFLTWAAKKPDDYRRRAAAKVATDVKYWPTVQDALRHLTDTHRDQVEPFLKQAWEEHGNGKYSAARFEDGRRSVSGSGEHVGRRGCGAAGSGATAQPQAPATQVQAFGFTGQ